LLAGFTESIDSPSTENPDPVTLRVHGSAADRPGAVILDVALPPDISAEEVGATTLKA
jgi:hypothetical protein